MWAISFISCFWFTVARWKVRLFQATILQACQFQSKQKHVAEAINYLDVMTTEKQLLPGTFVCMRVCGAEYMPGEYNPGHPRNIVYWADGKWPQVPPQETKLCGSFGNSTPPCCSWLVSEECPFRIFPDQPHLSKFLTCQPATFWEQTKLLVTQGPNFSFPHLGLLSHPPEPLRTLGRVWNNRGTHLNVH